MPDRDETYGLAISPRDMKSLQPFLTQRQFSTGEYVLRYGEQGSSLFVILSGVAEISRAQKAGRKVVIARRSPGQVVGEIAALTGSPRTADVRALGACVFGEIGVGTLEDVFTKVPSFRTYLMRLLAARLAESTEQSVDFAICDVPTLVLKALRSFSSVQIQNGEKSRVVNQRPTHEELAEMVGSSREVVTRAMKLLEQAGEIKVEGEQILVRG